MLFALLMAGGASAAQITALPRLGNGVFVAANADADACSTVFDQLAGCASSFGGVDAIATADPDDLMQCACCASSRKVADAYGDCSSYIVDEMPAMSTDADLYGQLGGFCEGIATCGPTGSNNDDDEPTSTSADGAPSTTEGPGDDDLPSTTSDMDAITSSFAELDAGCSNLADMIDSCSMATPGFTDLGYASQAKCYCCGGRSSTWTDEFDQYASTCANWAVTAEPDTIYVVASRYATFCENFDGACEPATTITEDSDSEPTGSPSETTGTDAEETGDSDGSNGDGNGSSNDDDDSLGSGLKVQLGATMAAVLFGGMAIIL